jgi:hypothetical protein
MAEKKTKTTAKASTAKAEPTQQPAPQQQVEGLTLQDLIQVANIIQLSSQRGAFRAEEFQQVGALYTKLIAFLQQTGAIATDDQTAKAEETK